MKNYSDRFREFLGVLPGAESLDDTQVLAPTVKIKRADYLLFQRSMIAEVKQLESDPEYKVEAVVERYRSHPSYPLFYGRRTLEEVLAHMPQEIREELRQAVYDSISRSINEGCEDANRQIRQTRSHFELAQAAGVVFILNDRVPILSPSVLAARIEQQLHKRTADGGYRFPEIAFVCAFSWAHFVRGADGTPAHPVLIMAGPAASACERASGQLDYIIHAWTLLEDAHLLEGAKATRELLENCRNALPEEASTQIRKQDAWRIAYRQEPYLAQLSEQDLLAHGQRALSELAPHFLVGQKAQGDDLPAFFGPQLTWKTASFGSVVASCRLNSAGVSCPRLECGRTSLY